MQLHSCSYSAHVLSIAAKNKDYYKVLRGKHSLHEAPMDLSREIKPLWRYDCGIIASNNVSKIRDRGRNRRLNLAWSNTRFSGRARHAAENPSGTASYDFPHISSLIPFPLPPQRFACVGHSLTDSFLELVVRSFVDRRCTLDQLSIG